MNANDGGRWTDVVELEKNVNLWYLFLDTERLCYGQNPKESSKINDFDSLSHVHTLRHQISMHSSLAVFDCDASNLIPAFNLDCLPTYNFIFYGGLPSIHGICLLLSFFLYKNITILKFPGTICVWQYYFVFYNNFDVKYTKFFFINELYFQQSIYKK